MPRRVRLAERGEHLDEDVDDAPERAEAVVVDDAGEVAPPQELHHEIELPAVLAEVDDADRIRVIEPARRPRLGDETRRRALVSEKVLVDDLDRDRAPERLLLRAVNAAHSADADQLQDDVAAWQGGADERIVGLLRDLAHRKATDRAEAVTRLDGCGALRAGNGRHGREATTPGERCKG